MTSSDRCYKINTWENEGSVPTRGTGNYSSDEAKEIARLQRELRDTKDALEILGVSRSGYCAWKQRSPSVSEKHRNYIKDEIKQIYDDSHQNYGAPKITAMLHKQGERIAEKRQVIICTKWE